MIYSPTKPPIGTQIDWSDPLSKGLLGCWLFNEGGGIPFNVVNTKQNLTNSAVWGNSGLIFNGSSSYSDTVNSIAFNSLPQMTVIAVAKASVSANSLPIISKSTNVPDTTDWFLKTTAASTVKMRGFVSYSTTGATATDPATLDTNWHTWAITVVGQVVVLYKDGIFCATATGVGTRTYGTQPVYIGKQNEGANGFWNGIISSCYLYDRALLAQEIRRLHELTKGW